MDCLPVLYNGILAINSLATLNVCYKAAKRKTANALRKPRLLKHLLVKTMDQLMHQDNRCIKNVVLDLNVNFEESIKATSLLYV